MGVARFRLGFLRIHSENIHFWWKGAHESLPGRTLKRKPLPDRIGRPMNPPAPTPVIIARSVFSESTLSAFRTLEKAHQLENCDENGGSSLIGLCRFVLGGFAELQKVGLEGWLLGPRFSCGF